MAEKIYDDYIPNLIDSMLTNIGIADSSCMLIKHYNSFDLDKDYIKDIAATRTKFRFLYHSFEPIQMIGPYEPFLEWIKETIDDLEEFSYSEFLEKCDIYPLHKPIFLSYFEKGLCKRKEELLIGEISFEKKKLLEEIIFMLLVLSEYKPLVLIFNKMHAAGTSTLSLIEKIITSKQCKNIAILATYNEISNVQEYAEKTWNSLISKFEERDSILDWTFNTTTIDSDSNVSFTFSQAKLAEYYLKLNNMYYFLALDQAEYYLDVMYHKFEVEKVYIIPKYKFVFLELSVKVSMYQDKTSDALLYCNGMRNIVRESDDDGWKYRYNYIAAQVHMYSFQLDISKKYVDACEAVCKKINNPYFDFKVALLKYMIRFHGWRNMWLLISDASEGSLELIELCKKYNYLNHLAHIYVYSYGNDSYKFADVNTVEDILVEFKEGISIAQKLGNEPFIIEGYKKNVMIASTSGYYDVANMYYEKSYEIVCNNNDIYEEAGIYNGMGYNCCTVEKYAKANEYYNKALIIFAKLNDIEAINETIYNMAFNAILAEDYAIAESYLTVNLRIIKIMKTNSVRVCNISKIYGLRAYCCYMQKVLYNCKINMQYVEQFLGHIIEIEDMDQTDAHLWDDDLFLYYFISGLMLEHENNLEKAYKKMQKAKKYVERSKGSEFFNLTPYSIAHARICRKLGYDDQAREILLKCLDFCDKREYIYKKNKIKAELDRVDIMPMKWNLSFKGITIDSIIEKAMVAGMERDYNEQTAEINFLSIWQKVINNNDTDVQRAIDNAITTLKNNYNLDEVTFIRIEDNKPVLRYNDSKYDITEAKIKFLCKYFTANRSEFITTRLDKGYMEHKDLINNIFGFNSINTLICAPIFINEQLSGLFICCITIDMDWNYKNKRYQFDNNDLSILMMLFRQLMDAIDRMEAQNKIERINNELQFVNERLKEVAVKDNLTSLFNRQGFQEELEIEAGRKTYKNESLELSILYADLDNFKYYNDTFGHDVGDLILKGFAQIISDICKDRGYAVRYGGDEFILIIYSRDYDEIEEAAKTIYRELEAREGFTKEISEKMGKPVVIPQDRHVSCSVGISDAVISPDDIPKIKIEETLKRADAMMYYVKKTTKHRYVFYGDVKEDVDKIVSGEVKKEKLKR